MSCWYDVHCIDCNSTAGVYYGGSDPRLEEIRDIIQVAPSLAEMAVAGKRAGLNTIKWGNYYEWNLDIDWFIKHGNHKLSAISEYGELDTKCAKRVECKHCVCYHHYCPLDKDHEGECVPPKRK